MNSCYTNNEIEELAEAMIRQYLGNPREIPLRVDIDGFVTQYLRLHVEYHSFAEEDMGKIAFISDGITPLRIMVNGRPVRHVLPKGTVVLEKYLLNPTEEGRRRFSLAHEAAHYITDRTVTAAAYRREFDSERTYSPQELRDLLSFQESRIDRLGAALIMPRFMVRNIVDLYAGKSKISMHYCTTNYFEKRQDHFVCANYRSNTGNCSAHFIRAVVLEELVWMHMEAVISYVTHYEAHFRAAMEKRLKLSSGEAVRARRKKLAQGEKRLDELDRLFIRLYEDI